MHSPLLVILAIVSIVSALPVLLVSTRDIETRYGIADTMGRPSGIISLTPFISSSRPKRDVEARFKVTADSFTHILSISSVHLPLPPPKREQVEARGRLDGLARPPIAPFTIFSFPHPKRDVHGTIVRNAVAPLAGERMIKIKAPVDSQGNFYRREAKDWRAE